MLEFIISLPFSIEVWKTVSILSLGAIAFLVRIYNKYFALQDFVEKDIKNLKTALDKIEDNISDICNQREELNTTIDKFIGVITTTDEISIKQKEQIVLLNKIIDNFKVQDVCELKDIVKDDENLNLKKLLEIICDEYELHKKD